MSTSAPATRWIAATAGVCVTGLVGSWVLLLGPQLDAAAATRAQATEVRTQNAALASRLAELRADHEHIEDYRADLAALRRQLPDDARLSQLTREIDGAARAAGVTLVRMDVTDAVDVATAAAATAAATPAPAAAAAPADGATTAEPAAPADGTAADPAVAPVAPATPAAPPVPGMIAIPVTTTVAGSVDGVRAFLAALQTTLERQVLVTALTITALEGSTGADGTPAAAAGDVQAVVGALAYVLPGEAADEAPLEGPLPTGPGGGSFLASAPQSAEAPTAPAAPEAAPVPDPAIAAAAAAAALEERIAAATAAAEAAAAHAAEHAATAQAAEAAASAASAASAGAAAPATAVDAG